MLGTFLLSLRVYKLKSFKMRSFREVSELRRETLLNSEAFTEILRISQQIGKAEFLCRNSHQAYSL